MAKQVKLTWVISGIQAQTRHCRTIHALGLRRLHHSVIKEDTPPVRGMIESVKFMLKVEEVNG